MFGRVGKFLLVALLTEVGGALIQAGRGWLEGKLLPQARLPSPSPAAQAGAVVATPQGTVIVDAEGQAIGFSDEPQQASKKAHEAPVHLT
ncbi:hypothetical protein [uncultured Sphingobium sp.]|uniref:hypothetical protein n=1 Tax=uncultured Sphingobium sp. TaxID=316087 RepID=UPI00259B92A0|nr:hypothetical protein [uncultured Sphingobium sp.]